MSKEIGFAVVGLGMGRHHCKAIQAAPGARLVAVCDLDEERLRPTAQEYGCRAYTTLDELLRDEEVEVVNIATPSGTHAVLGARCAAAGKHLIVEKPADILAGRIEELLAAVRQHGVKAAGIFQSRLDPLNIHIRQAIQQGRLGTLIGAHGHLPWYRAQSYYEGRHGSWKGTWDMDGGGSLMNQGVHTVDLLQWLAGPVAAAMGAFGVFGHRIEAEDQTVALLRFANGALGTLYTTTCCYPGFNQRLTLYGTRGTIIKEEGSLHSWKMQDDPEGKEEQELLVLYGAGRKASGAADPMAVGFDGHTQIIMDMIGAINEDRQPLITLESARHAVEIINAIYLAGRTGREVKVGEKPASVPQSQPAAAKLSKADPRTGHRKGMAPGQVASAKAPAAEYSKPSSAGRSKPASGGYSKPSSEGRSKPASGGYSKPSSAGRSKPASGGYSKPSPAGRGKPASGGYDKPSPAGRGRPTSGGYDKPSPAGRGKPASGGYDKPSPAGRGRPASGGDSKPSSAGRSEPTSGGYDKPSPAGRGRPASGGYSKPSGAVRSGPSPGGYNKPSSAGRGKPVSGGYSKPSSAGRTRPPVKGPKTSKTKGR